MGFSAPCRPLPATWAVKRHTACTCAEKPRAQAGRLHCALISSACAAMYCTHCAPSCNMLCAAAKRFHDDRMRCAWSAPHSHGWRAASTGGRCLVAQQRSHTRDVHHLYTKVPARPVHVSRAGLANRFVTTVCSGSMPLPKSVTEQGNITLRCQTTTVPAALRCTTAQVRYAYA